MIRSLPLLVLVLTLPQLALAEDDAAQTPSPAPAPQQAEDEVGRHRATVEELNERMIGTASQAVRFNWRTSSFSVGATSSALAELNNFGSSRLGIFARKPLWGLLWEVALTRAWTWSTPSSDLLSLTPYRQHGRPTRFELDLNVGFPIAEGVVTAWPAFFPATQLVLSANTGLRYLIYPGSTDGLPFLDAARALVAPRLLTEELANLEARRNPGMEIDPARYGLMAGLSVDVYLHQGVFVSPRALVAVPLLGGLSGSRLGWWWELTFAAGFAF